MNDASPGTALAPIPKIIGQQDLYESWRDRAACKGMPTIMWYSPDPRQRAQAIAVCSGCPVRSECGAHASSVGEEGIWGGAERRGRARTKICEPCGRPFVTTRPRQRTCGAPRCVQLLRRTTARIRKRRRDSGERLDAGHGTISRYNSGCHCSACRRAARDVQVRRRAAKASR